MPAPRTACFLLALAAAATDVAAQQDGVHDDLPAAVARVERETGGKVLQVKPIQRGDREVYRMKVLTPDGRVKIVQDDPKRHRPRRGEAAEPEPETPPPERRQP